MQNLLTIITCFNSQERSRVFVVSETQDEQEQSTVQPVS
jgi:hypothetical protein